MALSVALQTGEDSLSFGESSRDSLILSIGTDLVLCYLLAACLSQILGHKRIGGPSRRIVLAFVAVMLSLNFALTFVSNAIVTRATQNSTGAFMQSALASAVSHPDTTAQGDKIRCALIVKKIMEFPEWEGHDRALVHGLNTSFNNRMGVDFCSRPIDGLFEKYPLNDG